MIAWWMTQLLVIGAWLGLGAAALDLGLRRLGRPTRGVWAGALVLLTVLSAWTIGRPAEATTLAPGPVALPSGGPVVTAAAPAAPWQHLFALPQDLVRTLGGAAWRWQDAAGLEPWLLAAWGLTSTGMATLLLLFHFRIAHRRRGWHVLPDAEGVAVRVSQDEGPFVLGLAPSEIVVPAWTATLPGDGRAWIIAHEREHVRGGDPWLLAVANAVLVALPWHPVAWWLHARLRLAVELDCDRRCLAAGTDAGTYGRLLLAAAGHTQSRLPWRAVAPAFATRRSHLERRLLAMTHATRRPRRALAVTAAAAALVAGVAACESSAPTAAQVAAADASTVKGTLLPAVADSAVTYVVNGKVVSYEDAKRVKASDIATVSVAKRDARAEVRLEIKDDRTAAEWTPAAPRSASGSATPALDQALIVIDGVVQPSTATLSALSPDRIANVEILKGNAARALYDVTKYPNAANGVVRITTKR